MRLLITLVFASANAQINSNNAIDKCHQVFLPDQGCNTLFCDDLELADGNGPTNAALNQCNCGSTCYYSTITNINNINNVVPESCPNLGSTTPPPQASGEWCLT